MGAPAKFPDNPKIPLFRPNTTGGRSQTMRIMAESFPLIGSEVIPEISTSENSPTNQPKDIDFQESSPGLARSNDNKTSTLEPLIIDVKPKRKIFQNEEEKKKFIEGFTQKKKTELCKNWEMNGTCRYGDNCSFAHGKEELKIKTHLNSNYKQKPCKQFLLKGICFYGNRCQYLHREIKYYPEHKDFLIKNQKKCPEALNSLLNYKSEGTVLKKMEKAYEKVKDAEKFLLNRRPPVDHKRLPVFSAFGNATVHVI